MNIREGSDGLFAAWKVYLKTNQMGFWCSAYLAGGKGREENFGAVDQKIKGSKALYARGV